MPYDLISMLESFRVIQQFTKLSSSTHSPADDAAASSQVPHYYLTVDTRVDKLLALRSQINESLAASGEGKLSVNDFIIKASALVSA